LQIRISVSTQVDQLCKPNKLLNANNNKVRYNYTEVLGQLHGCPDSSGGPGAELPAGVTGRSPLKPTRFLCLNI